MNKQTSRAIGLHAEHVAAKALRRRGLQVVARNVSCRFGEIDLIMRHRRYIVFVEVRYRRGDAFGAGADTVGRLKQQRLRRVAQWYLQRHGLTAEPCRFDVVSVSGNLHDPKINWIRDAF